jgi:hypothetical protein
MPREHATFIGAHPILMRAARSASGSPDLDLWLIRVMLPGYDRMPDSTWRRVSPGAGPIKASR